MLSLSLLESHSLISLDCIARLYNLFCSGCTALGRDCQAACCSFGEDLLQSKRCMLDCIRSGLLCRLALPAWEQGLVLLAQSKRLLALLCKARSPFAEQVCA